MQTLKLFFFTSLFLLAFSCNSNKKNNPIINEVDTSSSQKNKTIKEDSFIKYSIDTLSYLGLPHYDTTMYHNGSQGYIDTFNIHGNQFRIVHQDTIFDGTVEKKQNGQWCRLSAFENLGNYNDYDVHLDMDGDGYNDLIFYWKWFGEIHFFDTLRNEYCDTVNCEIGRDWDIVDSTDNVFYENDFGKQIHSPVSSNLLTFKNKKRVVIATLTIAFDPEGDNYPFMEGDLYLGDNQKQIDKIIPKEKVSIDDFDYKKFWKEHYKKLLNSR